VLLRRLRGLLVVLIKRSRLKGLVIASSFGLWVEAYEKPYGFVSTR